MAHLRALGGGNRRGTRPMQSETPKRGYSRPRGALDREGTEVIKMNMTYLLLSPPDPELAKRLQKRFPATFGGPRPVETSVRKARAKERRDSRHDSLMPQAA